VRHADVEEEIVQRSVHQRKGKDEPPVLFDVSFERPPAAAGNGQHNQPCRREADAGKEHLAARHVCRDAKGTETYLDERECPSPRYSRRQGKHRHPYWPLEYRSLRWFHCLLIFILVR